MLRDTPAFSSFSVDSVPAARDFYGGTLGLELATPMEGLLELRLAGGGRALLYPKDDHAPASFTVLNFVADDLDATVDALQAAGVPFERYPELGEVDARGTHHGPGPRIAWFRDPAGNILSVLAGSEVG